MMIDGGKIHYIFKFHIGKQERKNSLNVRKGIKNIMKTILQNDIYFATNTAQRLGRILKASAPPLMFPIMTPSLEAGSPV